MKKKSKEELAIIGLLSVVFVVVLYIYFTPITLFDFGAFAGNLPEFEFEDMTDFQRFAIVVTVLYDMLPTLAQQFSIGAITIQLIQSGFSPLLLGVVSVFALLGGQMILYGLGLIFKKFHHGINKSGFGNIAGHNHLLHKYHFLIYLIVPFVGILGDIVMVGSGHQRIRLIKIVPFLLIGNAISVTRWLAPAMFQLELGSMFT